MKWQDEFTSRSTFLHCSVKYNLADDYVYIRNVAASRPYRSLCLWSCLLARLALTFSFFESYSESRCDILGDDPFHPRADHGKRHVLGPIIPVANVPAILPSAQRRGQWTNAFNATSAAHCRSFEISTLGRRSESMAAPLRFASPTARVSRPGPDASRYSRAAIAKVWKQSVHHHGNGRICARPARIFCVPHVWQDLGHYWEADMLVHYCLGDM